MLDIDDAILSTTTITPGKLSLGESQAGPSTKTLTIKNNSSMAVTYDLSHAGALATGPNTFTPAFFASFAGVSFSASSVTVPAGGTKTVNVTITAPTSLADKGLYGGYIVFTPQSGGQTFRVPYAGFRGDYQSIVVLTSGGFGFPLVGRAVSCIRVVDGECIGGSYDVPPASYVYNLTSIFEQPSFLVHLDHQARRLRFSVVDANTGKSWHRFGETQFLPRNSTSTGFFAFAWDGTTTNGSKTFTVPDGQYIVTLSVLKALGNDRNPAHWEHWTSPVINIDRP
jgi:hypothetical protein